MKKSRLLSALLFVSLLFVLLPAIANGNASMWDVPVGPGESFRWVFVTSGLTAAVSPDITYYNWFINDWLMPPIAATPIYGVAGKDTLGEIQWKAIVSTPTTNAIDNMVSSSTPIYTPLGTRVADTTQGMFDSPLLAPIRFTEWGEEPQTQLPLVWTGTQWDGTKDPVYMLGGPNQAGVVGVRTWTGSFWVDFATEEAPKLYPLYAISEELTLVPASSALMLAATGLLSMLGLKRLRHKHQ